MKTISIILAILFTTTFCFADRVCLRKSNGKLIEYQSGNAPLGTLTQNAINNGYNPNDIEEKYVTQEEWLPIREEWIDKPTKQKITQKKAEKETKELSISNKLKVLGLTNNEINILLDK